MHLVTRPEMAIDRLAETQAYVALNWAHDDWAAEQTAEAVFGILTDDDEMASWALDHAPEHFLTFRLLTAEGEFRDACRIADLMLDELVNAVTTGQLQRSATPDEMRERNAKSFKLLTHVPREDVRSWLGIRRLQGTRSRERGRGRGRPRRLRGSRRSRSSSSSSTSGGDDGPGEPPPSPGAPRRRAPKHVVRFARDAGLDVDQLQWCRGCKRAAFAIDKFEREQLDALSFIGGLCPDCRGCER